MLTPQTLDKLPDELVGLIDELQTDIIKSIAKKITKADYLTPSAEWQLYKAAQLRMSTSEVNALLAKYSGKSKREIGRLYTEACKQAINEDAKIYRAYGKDASSFTRPVAFSNALKAGIANADGMMQNFTRSMVQSSRQTVTHLMDKAYLQVLSGAFSPQEAIYSAVAELAAKGIQSVTYPSGRTDWADVAVRRAVLTGVGQTTGRMQLDLAAEMGCDLVEVTSHMGARPSHAEWQGKVYSISGKSKKYPKLSTATGYGTGAGLKGWNCRHDFYPFFEGISERASLPINKAENAKEYELSQKQRSMERAIRKSKRGLAALNESINSTDDPELKAKLQSKFDRQSATLKRQERRMNDFCKANDLLVKNDRVRVVGFGRSVSQRAVHGNKRYTAKRSGGGSGTSDGTANTPSKTKMGGVDSKDKVQTVDYTEAKNTKKSDLIMSAGVDKSAESSIIKSINVDDISSVDKDGIVSEDCKSTIVKIIERFKNEGHNFNFDGVRIVDIPRDKDGKLDVMRTNAVDRYGYPQVFLEINKVAFAGASKADIDNIFFNADNTICSSLEDAVIHEIGHAKTIYSRTYPNYDRIYETLKEIHYDGVSALAKSDGLECIAECEVLLSRGETLPDELMEFYKKYTTGGG